MTNGVGRTMRHTAITVLAIVFLAIGAIGTSAACALEYWSGEAVYMLIMKVTPWFIGLGGTLLGVALGTGRWRR